ncbi:aspartate ammonia-lyase [Sphingomonas mali]|uniref:aspartate ammonia-lyase n=1 Tax=Sphingomonas mali TaxID=40682 RepID=UPI00083234FF|nr:aspartate ammonia-lyase [Sphingomonas mali]
MNDVRTDIDSMGPVALPATALYGPGAARARQNFAISGRTIGDFPAFVLGLATVKAASALANRDIGQIAPDVADAIVRATDELAAQRLNSDLVVDMFEGSGGTSINMNINEVLANRAAQLLGGEIGIYDRVHPNDHVNRCQSTNDVIPSAIKVGCRQSLSELVTELVALEAAFVERAQTFRSVLRVGRTCLQDAQPMTLGQSFGAHAVLTRRLVEALRARADELLTLPIGATAIGTGFGSAPGYKRAFFHHLSQRTGDNFAKADNLFDALANADVFTRLSGELRTAATSIAKIANDLILLSSGPAAGFAELALPMLQPGSSIMPGKVNPVVPMAICQLGFTLAGYDVVIAAAAQQGQLEINPYEPIIAFHLFEGMRILTNGLRLFRERCITGIEPNISRMEQLLHQSSAIATALLPSIGYDETSHLVQRAAAEGRTFTELAIAEGHLRKEQVDVLIGMAINPHD